MFIKHLLTVMILQVRASIRRYHGSYLFLAQGRQRTATVRVVHGAENRHTSVEVFVLHLEGAIWVASIGHYILHKYQCKQLNRINIYIYITVYIFTCKSVNTGFTYHINNAFCEQQFDDSVSPSYKHFEIPGTCSVVDERCLSVNSWY